MDEIGILDSALPDMDRVSFIMKQVLHSYCKNCGSRGFHTAGSASWRSAYQHEYAHDQKRHAAACTDIDRIEASRTKRDRLEHRDQNSGRNGNAFQCAGIAHLSQIEENGSGKKQNQRDRKNDFRMRAEADPETVRAALAFMESAAEVEPDHEAEAAHRDQSHDGQRDQRIRGIIHEAVACKAVKTCIGKGADAEKQAVEDSFSDPEVTDQVRKQEEEPDALKGKRILYDLLQIISEVGNVSFACRRGEHHPFGQRHAFLLEDDCSSNKGHQSETSDFHQKDQNGFSEEGIGISDDDRTQSGYAYRRSSNEQAVQIRRNFALDTDWQ